MFDKMKQLYEMQKQAKEMKKTVEALKVEKSSDGITLVMNGALKVETLSIDDAWLGVGKRGALESKLKELVNAATEEAGKLSAQEAMSLMKGLNLPGM